MVNKEFISLCSKAWTIQIIVYIAQGRDPRVSPIANYLSAGRTSISNSIQYLLKNNYLQRNSGHGHPLRPAYKITEKGYSVAIWALDLDNVITPKGWALIRKSWALPIIKTAHKRIQYKQLRLSLNPITDKALSDTLKLLCNEGWLQREINTSTTPPASYYVQTQMGTAIFSNLNKACKIV